jgi:uncharacterized protein
MKILLAGATGFIGRALREKLALAGHEVIVLTRQGRAQATGREKFVVWNGRGSGDWTSCLDGADAVINLAGENIAAKRWTPFRKQEILSSRVDATRAIVNAIELSPKKPAVLINVSAVGYYGDAAGRELTEASEKGAGFLAETCGAWEAEALRAERSGVRVVLARLGPVLGEKGGMLSKMLPPFRAFLGAPLGTGRQWIPWVHREDVTGAFLFTLEHQGISGPVNVTAPAPATMTGFCKALARALHRPLWFPVSSFLLKGCMGEMAMIVLSSQKAVPEKLLQAGYRFGHPDLAEAFASILDKGL